MRSSRHDLRPTAPGYHKGCFGSTTLGQRRAGTEHRSRLYNRSRSYARSYLTRRMKGAGTRQKYSGTKGKRMLQREEDRLTMKRYRKLRSKERAKYRARADRKT